MRLGVNYNTINKVYQDLERDGFIFTKRGRGSFVADVSRVDYSADDGEMEPWPWTSCRMPCRAAWSLTTSSTGARSDLETRGRPA